jgi:hypothetical protein
MLDELEITLAKAWRRFLDVMPEEERYEGTFRGGVDACAGQLERAIARMRKEITDGK